MGQDVVRKYYETGNYNQRENSPPATAALRGRTCCPPSRLRCRERIGVFPRGPRAASVRRPVPRALRSGRPVRRLVGVCFPDSWPNSRLGEARIARDLFQEDRIVLRGEAAGAGRAGPASSPGAEPGRCWEPQRHPVARASEVAAPGPSWGSPHPRAHWAPGFWGPGEKSESTSPA